jgi:predicted MFS family arabinose efflux permease
VVAVATLIINVLPALTDMLARYLHFDDRVLGAFASASYLGCAAGSFAALALLKKISPRFSVFTGIGVLAGSLLACAAVGRAPALVFLSAVGAFGAGLATSACYYVFSLSQQERNSGAGLLSQTALATLVIAAIPAVSMEGGWRWVFLALGFLTLPCVLFSFKFPSAYESVNHLETDAATAAKKLEWWALASTVLANLCIQMVWTYLGRMGSVAGIDETAIARGLSLSTVAGFVSSLLVLVQGERFARSGVLLPCVALTAIGIVAAGSPVTWIYVAGISIYYFSLPIFLSAQFGAIVRRASSKRFALSYTLATQIGGFGPAAGGFLVQSYGFGALRLVSIGLMFSSFFILWAGFLRQSASPQIGSLRR